MSKLNAAEQYEIKRESKRRYAAARKKIMRAGVKITKPWRCPDCGHLIKRETCVECSVEKTKELKRGRSNGYFD